MTNTPLWLPLASTDASIATTGGKGSSLAAMAISGLPVPHGFHLTSAAYHLFADNDEIQSIVAKVPLGDTDAVDEAASRIEALLDHRELPKRVTDAINDAYATMNDVPVAVRSSATAEDLPEASFAGQMESFLNIGGPEAIAVAVKRCWISLWTARAIDYRARAGLATAEVSMAVVVQELVDADAAGVMFTANPVTGDRNEIVINAAWGLGESVVNGTVSADTVVIDAQTRAVTGTSIADKTVKTVRVQAGTREIDVDEQQRRLPVLTDAAAQRLADIGTQVVNLYGKPMDVEWALIDDTFTVLQARPITNLEQTPDSREEWNDSRIGQFLWTASNVGEAVPNVMTPLTWSLTKIYMRDAMAIPGVGEYNVCGNIGGRLYINYTVLMDVARSLGMGSVMDKASSMMFSSPPESITIPRLPMSRWKVARQAIGDARRFSATVKDYQRNLDKYVAEFPGRCRAARKAIAETRTATELADLYHDRVKPIIADAPRMLGAGGRVNGMALAKLRPWLRKFVDDADANALVTGAHTSGESLASLGPLLGLRQLAAGEIDTDTYIETWGHRGTDELELFAPQPAEDPQWLKQRLAGLDDTTDVDELLSRQAQQRDAALKRFERKYPRKMKSLRRRMLAAEQAVRAREATRSEAVRMNGVGRDFALRAGEITGHGDDVFFLHFDELMALLRGDVAGLAKVPARRNAYDHYRKLPAYPTWISGTFDPETWAADPNRRADAFDSQHHDLKQPADSNTITGTAGSTGIADGVAKVLTDLDGAHRLNVGDILVTKVTNIGWTPVFPRIGAVVTDIGASLSHASVVARELGIPAVVGCGHATTRIKDGDRIRVNGGTGTVEILSAVDSAENG